MTISKIKLVKLTQNRVVVYKTDGTIWGTESVTELSNILKHNLDKQLPILHNDYNISHGYRAVKLWEKALKKSKVGYYNYLADTHILNSKDFEKEVKQVIHI
jgi:hypothetical protein